MGEFPSEALGSLGCPVRCALRSRQHDKARVRMVR